VTDIYQTIRREALNLLDGGTHLPAPEERVSRCPSVMGGVLACCRYPGNVIIINTNEFMATTKANIVA
jgi:hypothetical protein